MLRRLALAAFASLIVTSGARAESWIVDVGAQVSLTPPYEGADKDTVQPAPTFIIRRASQPRRFTPPDDGSSIAIIATRHLDIGPVVRIREDRSDHGDLEGLNKVRTAIEPGLFMDVWPFEWLRGRVEARRGVVGHEGWVGDLGLDLIYSGSHWEASLGPRIGWGDSRYMKTYFGVTPEEAARAPVIDTAYTPKAGQRYTGLEAAVSYRISRGWRVIYGAGYQRLASQAADSPIVQRAGSPNQYITSLGFSYRFGFGR
jgi:outer membrane scaffolding protein for murein synthesis (MipA/OmpV family)